MVHYRAARADNINEKRRRVPFTFDARVHPAIKERLVKNDPSRTEHGLMAMDVPASGGLRVGGGRSPVDTGGQFLTVLGIFRAKGSETIVEIASFAWNNVIVTILVLV